MNTSEFVLNLLGRMTVDEKIGQMTQAEKNSVTPEAVREYGLGSVLSGGGGFPSENTLAGWVRMVGDYQQAALQTRLGIPILYGVDAVHGHNNLHGAVIFPHNIGLGAAGEPDLAYRIGRATAGEMAATGANWDFAPTVAVPHDLRWGRTYEGFCQDGQRVAQFGSAYIRGLQGERLDDPLSVVATAKHYLGDGGTTWDTSHTRFPIPDGSHFSSPDGMYEWFIDRGDTRIDEAELRAVHLPPYIAAVQAGVQTVMASFSSWNGARMHAHHYLLTEVLKGELGFQGFVISDWGAIDLLDDDPYQATVAAINAGVDMSMTPMDYLSFISHLKRAVEQGDVPMARIDDAVRRILTVKHHAGLFERPLPDPKYFTLVGTAEHRALAREAAGKSVVLLKNEGQTLPLPKTNATILVGGQAADDIGLQCGGWTIEWLGKAGAITSGVTILEGLRAAAPDIRFVFDPNGQFVQNAADPAEYGLVVLAEQPYAEGFGDQADLNLAAEDVFLIERMRAQCRKLVLVLLSGRPLVLTGQLPLMDALAAAWLPGTEGQAVADVLFGDRPFTGRLPYDWPESMAQVPMPAGAKPLFPYGYGL